MNLKQPKRLTLSQKKLLTKRGYDANNYMLLSENDCEIEIIHKTTLKRETIER